MSSAYFVPTASMKITFNPGFAVENRRTALHCAALSGVEVSGVEVSGAPY